MKKIILGLLIISFGCQAQNQRIRDLTTENTPVGSMYVAIDATTYARAHKMTINTLNSLEAATRAAQDDVIEAGCGLAATGTYVVLTGSNFLTAADFAAIGLTGNLNNADFILDSIINEIYDTILQIQDTVIVNDAIKWAYSATRYTIDYDTIIRIDSSWVKDGAKHMILDSSNWSGTFDITINNAELYLDYLAPAFDAIEINLTKGIIANYSIQSGANIISATSDKVRYFDAAFDTNTLNSSLYFQAVSGSAQGSSTCYLYIRYSVVRYN